MKDFLKGGFLLLMCALLLAGQSCKKDAATGADHHLQDSIAAVRKADSIYLATRSDFRDSISGTYIGQKHHYYMTQPPVYIDTILGPDTFRVVKLSSDTFSITVADHTFSYVDTVIADRYIKYEGDYSTNISFTRQNGVWSAHYVYDDNGSWQRNYYYTDAVKR